MADQFDHFDRLYRAKADPWNYETSPYEAQKYDATIAALTKMHYPSAIEAGCSIGVLSERLSSRCSRLLALDFASFAVAQAQKRLLPFANATAQCVTLPDGWPRGLYDLIMLSELVYYLSAPDVAKLARYVARDAAWGAECVLVHYQGDTQTEISPDVARDLFCNTVADLRQITIVDHPATGSYNHRTVLFRDTALTSF